ncbi:MAG: hypothetical protein AB8G26_01175 [Ilumatobacter sp.]
MSATLWSRFALGYALVISVQIGGWALVAPRSFYDDFPGLGRSWVSIDGPYNEHLVRDVGALNLAVSAVLLAAFIRPRSELLIVSGIAVLVWGVPHAVYHVFNTDGLGAADAVASVGGLVLFSLIGGGLLWAARTKEVTR